jgi:hypothetical protein
VRGPSSTTEATPFFDPGDLVPEKDDKLAWLRANAPVVGGGELDRLEAGLATAFAEWLSGDASSERRTSLSRRSRSVPAGGVRASQARHVAGSLLSDRAGETATTGA